MSRTLRVPSECVHGGSIIVSCLSSTSANLGMWQPFLSRSDNWKRHIIDYTGTNETAVYISDFKYI